MYKKVARSFIFYLVCSIDICADKILISLGADCQAAMRLRQLKLRQVAYPFDWLRSYDFNGLLKCIQEKLALRSLRKFYSQVGQDRFVYTKFFEQLGDNYQGTFVEIGAHDGITHSNSLFFEKELGWRGVCIEPRASAFNLLIKNRKCDCLKACIAANNGKKLFLEVEGYAAELSGLVDLYDPRHRERIDREIAQYGGKSKIVEVDCVDFSTLCQRYGLKTIDFMSIDTEGCELEILRNIDFSKIDIRVVAIENNYGSPEIMSIMRLNGFVFIGKLSNGEIYLKGVNYSGKDQTNN